MPCQLRPGSRLPCRLSSAAVPGHPPPWRSCAPTTTRGNYQVVVDEDLPVARDFILPAGDKHKAVCYARCQRRGTASWAQPCRHPFLLPRLLLLLLLLLLPDRLAASPAAGAGCCRPRAAAVKMPLPHPDKAAPLFDLQRHQAVVCSPEVFYSL